MEEILGIIKLFAGNFAPQGYMFCHGQDLLIRRYNALYAVIGNAYGGDGVVNFKLPDLRERVPVGATPNFVLGKQFGSKTLSLKNENLPQIKAKVTTLNANAKGIISGTANAIIDIPCDATNAGLTNLPTGNYIALGNASDGINPANSFSTVKNATLKSFTASVPINITANLPVEVNGEINITGGGNSTPIDILQPALGLNYIICIEGVFPNQG
jgi:microcystin-dependent protein